MSMRADSRLTFWLTGAEERHPAKIVGDASGAVQHGFDDGLLDANPFTKVKLKLDDDSTRRDVLTRDDLVAIFGRLTGEDWWIARIALCTGARITEVCQLTKPDVQMIEGVSFLHIREDVREGKSVKTRGSTRKVSLHRQLIADGLLGWIKAHKTEALFSGTAAAASKRLNRRMRGVGLGRNKPFHSFRHIFKGAARRYMDMEWHDRLTGHASKSVGQRYGDYDLRTLKEKIDLIVFGIETAPPSPPAAPRRHSPCGGVWRRDANRGGGDRRGDAADRPGVQRHPAISARAKSAP